MTIIAIVITLGDYTVISIEAEVICVGIIADHRKPITTVDTNKGECFIAQLDTEVSVTVPVGMVRLVLAPMRYSNIVFLNTLFY